MNDRITFAQHATIERSKPHGTFAIIHNHVTSNYHTPPVFKTTKRLPGTSEYVALNYKRTKAVKA